MKHTRRSALLRVVSLLVVVGSSVVGLLLATARADVELHGLFTDHAVLQRDRVIRVWGWADGGEAVEVRLAGQLARATADSDGLWQVELEPLPAGGPHEMLVSGKTTVQLKDILVGDVWVCSGQSNMQWPLHASHDAAAEIAEARDAGLRLFTVPRRGTEEPQADVGGSWAPCSPESARDFSAVAYFFGRDLRRRLDVPIGLISSNYGGTPAEAWTSREKLKAVAELHPILEYPKNPDRLMHYPGGLFNAMIHPLLRYPIRGAIWYQGESNAGRAWQYRTLFPAMIQCWREKWNVRDFPFLLVQLAPFDPRKKHLQGPGESEWAELREAQLLTTKVLPKVAMAVITDVGEMEDIHPKRKEEVGARLAIAARALAYSEELEYSGPQPSKVEHTDGALRITFSHAERGLAARVGNAFVTDADQMVGFTVCGEDHVFHPAKVKVVGKNVLLVYSELVPCPIAARFGWADFPVVNLWNREGLPASPFRTDEFSATTRNNP